MMMHLHAFCDCVGNRVDGCVGGCVGDCTCARGVLGMSFASRRGVKAVLETDTLLKQGHNVMLEMRTSSGAVSGRRR